MWAMIFCFIPAGYRPHCASFPHFVWIVIIFNGGNNQKKKKVESRYSPTKNISSSKFYLYYIKSGRSTERIKRSIKRGTQEKAVSRGQRQIVVTPLYLLGENCRTAFIAHGALVFTHNNCRKIENSQNHTAHNINSEPTNSKLFFFIVQHSNINWK